MERTKGLIIKQSDYGEGNRMLTIFTEDFGIIKAAVYGVKKGKSRQSAASQFLSWSEFILYFGRGEVASVISVTAIESFFPVQEDLEKLALCTYLTDLTLYVQESDSPNPPLLRLLLNTIYACAYKEMPIKKAKAVFELRLAQDMGYMPTTESCSACGEKCLPTHFSSECGGFVCKTCHSPLRDDIPVSISAYNAVRYILYSEEKKIFSFEVIPEVLGEMSRLSEAYILYLTERKFSSLEYLKNILT